MNMRSAAAMTGLLLSISTGPSWGADHTGQGGYKMIDIAGHQVPFVAGGLYDRYRSNPPLTVIQAEAPGLDLSWFKDLKTSMCQSSRVRCMPRSR